MKTSTRIIASSLLALLAVPALAADEADRPNRGDLANERLDQRGERRDERLDA
jgi:hypothetical protein